MGCYLKPDRYDGMTPGENYEQIGVVSFSKKQCRKSGHGFLAKITEMLDWIKISVGTEYTGCPRGWKIIEMDCKPSIYFLVDTQNLGWS